MSLTIIKNGAKIWLPTGIQCDKYTPKKNMPFILCMVEVGILQETKIKHLYTYINNVRSPKIRPY